MSAIQLSPSSPPRKKLRVPQPSDFSSIDESPVPSSNGNRFGSYSPLCCISDNIPAGIQGARHAQFGLSSSDLHFNKLHMGLFPVGFLGHNHNVPPIRIPTSNFIGNAEEDENISCLLTMKCPASLKGKSKRKRPHILLFGQLILTEQQSFQSCCDVTNGNSLSNGNPEKTANYSDG